MLLIVKSELLQFAADAEEILFKATLVTVTATAIIRFVAIDCIETIHRLREEKNKHLRKPNGRKS